MGAAPGAGWEEGEFEFKLVFEEESQGPSSVRAAGPESSVPAEESEGALLHLDPSNSSSSLGESHLFDGRTLKSRIPDFWCMET